MLSLTRNNPNQRVFLFSFVLLSLIPSLVLGGLPQRLIENKMQASLAPIIERASPAVVNIATYSIQRTYSPLLQSPFFRHFFALPDSIEEQRRVQSAGSGVIVDAQAGYVLTNHHVIAGADEIEVTLQDGRKLSARLIGSDKKVDMALLQIKSERLTSIPLADSSQLVVGDFVIAIGNPFGLGQTVTSGIVSAIGRNGLGIQGYEDFIQTDASINPGNSGGALIDLNGKLVGINSAIIAPAGGNVGIGFAIPTEVATSIMQQLIQYGEVRRGGIGAQFQDLTSELAEAFSLNTFQGAIVAQIEVGSEAYNAGLQQGDIVVRANGRKVTNASDIKNRIGLSPVGQKLTLDIIRNGEVGSVSMEVVPIPIPQEPGRNLTSYLDGTVLEDVIPPDEEASVGILVKELERGSYAERLGFSVGDILFGVDRTRIYNLKELKSYVSAREPQAFRIRRGYEDLIIYLR